jgi:hypothetical protein
MSWRVGRIEEGKRRVANVGGTGTGDVQRAVVIWEYLRQEEDYSARWRSLDVLEVDGDETERPALRSWFVVRGDLGRRRGRYIYYGDKGPSAIWRLVRSRNAGLELGNPAGCVCRTMQVCRGSSWGDRSTSTETSEAT